jgi:hypothetical protein
MAKIPTHRTKHNIELASADSGAASEADREWFERHPERAHLVRPAVPGEAYLHRLDSLNRLHDGCQWYTLVKQIRPGIRVRYIFASAGNVPIWCAEETAREIFANAIPRLRKEEEETQGRTLH